MPPHAVPGPKVLCSGIPQPNNRIRHGTSVAPFLRFYNFCTTIRLMQEETPPEKKKKDNFFSVFFFTLLLAVFVRFFIAQPFIVNGDSMVPTFDSGEYLVVDELTYRFRNPSRGEIIIFRYPKDTSKFFIKRIVGLPGETIRISNTGIFISKGGVETKLEEPYIASTKLENSSRMLAENEYFVMGDNRQVSSDSRRWGPVPENLIIGRAIFRFLPITEAGVLPGRSPSGSFPAPKKPL